MSPARESRSLSLGDALRSYVGRIDKQGKLKEAAVVDAWVSVTGPGIATHTKPAGLRNGELLVAVDSSVWANELSAMSESLRVRLNEQTGQELVRRIRFTVSAEVQEAIEQAGEQAASERRYGGTRVDPVRLTEGELRAVEKSLAGVEDEALREAALRATIRDLEWKKGLETSNVAHSELGGLSGSESDDMP